MKKIILLQFLLNCALLLTAQKQDYNWISGGSIESANSKIGLYNINFNDNSIKILGITQKDSNQIFMSNSNNVTYSHPNGELAFFSNGLRIYDWSFNTMLNGDTINPGYNWELSKNGKAGYNTERGICALPDPENQDRFNYLIHLGLDTCWSWLTYLYGNPLYFSKIDLFANGGLGKVIKKNIVLENGHFESIAAVRHANGRDWWILIPELYFNKYHRFLVTPEGIIGPWIQEIGPNFTIDGGSFISAKFSSSGDKYVRGWVSEGKSVVFDFDRCKGLLSNDISIKYSPKLYIVENILSPSGKFLYLSTHAKKQLFQVDLADFSFPLVEIANSKNILCNGKEYFFTSFQYGPDGKIYIDGGLEKFCISVINKPDKKFPDCDVNVASIEIPFSNLSFPYFPNYRLGPLIGSGCDTLSTSTKTVEEIPKISIYPNPVSTTLSFELNNKLSHEKSFSLTIYQPSGKEIYKGGIPAFAYLHNVNVSSWLVGMYYFSVTDDQYRSFNGKFIVVR